MLEAALGLDRLEIVARPFAIASDRLDGVARLGLAPGLQLDERWHLLVLPSHREAADESRRIVDGEEEISFSPRCFDPKWTCGIKMPNFSRLG